MIFFFSKLLEILFSFHIKKGKVFKNYKFRKKLKNINFNPKKRKTGNSAKFRPHSQKRTLDSATKKIAGICQNPNRGHFRPKIFRPV